MYKKGLSILVLIIVFCSFHPQVISQDNARVDEQSRDIRLPANDAHLDPVKGYVEDVPDKDYYHATAEAYEAFQDIKYGVRIHWGIYSILHMNNESWGFLNLPNKEKQKYQELYKSFNPVDFNAEKWMQIFDSAGFRCMAFTAKHHEGFSMFDTKTKVRQRAHYYPDGTAKLEPCNLSYSIMETPFKRDIVGELCTAAHAHNIKIDLYFSHPDWYDADFRPMVFHPVQTPKSVKFPYEEFGDADNYTKNKTKFVVPDPTRQEFNRMIARHREQLNELLSSYGKIDMVCLDMWLSRAAWPELRSTIKSLRKQYPDVMFRARGIGNYGDYYTPEGFVPGNKENTKMPWMTIHTLGTSFSYDSVATNYKGSRWIFTNLVDAVSKGGNFMVGIGPDELGNFHPEALRQLDSVGRWLRVNGEAIYATRTREVWKQGDSIRFTRSKDTSIVYAIALTWPGKQMSIPSIGNSAVLNVTLLGYDKPLPWKQTPDAVTIELPSTREKIVSEQTLGWVIKVELKK